MALKPPQELVAGVLIDVSNQDLYPVQINVNTLVTQATLHNTTGTTRVVTIWVGATATDATKRFKRAIAPDDTVEIDGLVGKVIAGTSKIIAVCDAASAVSATLSGTKFDVAG